MDIWRSLDGMVQLEITSASPEQCLESISARGIPVYRVQVKGDLTIRLQILRKTLSAVRKICEQRGDSVRITDKIGLYWSFLHLGKRPVLFCCILLLSFATIWLPRHVLFVQVQGNSAIPTNHILEAAEKCGISIGATRSVVRSEKMKNALLAEVPDLQWAGVNTKGCVALVSVREKKKTEVNEADSVGCSIIASRDGIITSCTAVRGNLLCEEGQAVKRGQTLISGYTDCGIQIQVTAAQGEIFAQTQRPLSAVTPKIRYRKTAEIEKGYQLSLLIGKKRIKIWKDSGIWDATCDRMYEEYYVLLPGGFQLPVALCVDSFYRRNVVEEELPEDTALASFQDFAKQYLSNEMIAGQILVKQECMTAGDTHYLFQGNYWCSEMIGRVQAEEIGEHYG